jgi:predicted oxidoreductase
MSYTNSSLSFSPLIIGTMRLGDWGVKMTSPQLEHFIESCLDMGLSDFDHADIYGGYTEEAAFGAVLRKRPELRPRMQLTTKCGIKMIAQNRPEHQLKHYDSGKAHIISSVENSLRCLHTDYLDLLLLHRPDFLMDPAEIAEAFEQLRQAGKVRYFGVSNFSPSQVSMLQQFTRLENHQVEISLTHLAPFENGILDQCIQYNIRPTAWSPFGGGALFQETNDPALLRIQNCAKTLARQYETGVDQILLAFLMRHPSGIIPVLGSTNRERIAVALKAADIILSRADWYALWQAAKGMEVP